MKVNSVLSSQATVPKQALLLHWLCIWHTDMAAGVPVNMNASNLWQGLCLNKQGSSLCCNTSLCLLLQVSQDVDSKVSTAELHDLRLFKAGGILGPSGRWQWTTGKLRRSGAVSWNKQCTPCDPQHFLHNKASTATNAAGSWSSYKLNLIRICQHCLAAQHVCFIRTSMPRNQQLTDTPSAEQAEFFAVFFCNPLL